MPGSGYTRVSGELEINWNESTQYWAGAIVALAAVVAEIKYHEIAKDALEKANDIADRIFDIEADITNHWMIHQYPQTLAVLEEIYAYAPPGTDYGGALGKGNEYGENLHAAAQEGVDIARDRYRFCPESGCDRELDIHAAAAKVDFAQQIMRHQERRSERQTQIGIEFASRAYRASREAPDDIFSLLQNAQNTYANIYNAASQSEEGAIGLIGSGIGTFIGGFFNT